jgi:hypothetical protein
LKKQVQSAAPAAKLLGRIKRPMDGSSFRSFHDRGEHAMTRSFAGAFGALAVVVAGFVYALALGAQETQTADQPAASGSEETEEEREYRRLPPYYAQVIAPYQREKIYAIQAKYEDDVKELQEQIRAILAKRDAEIEQVLFPEQREVLKQLKAEAAAARAKTAAEKRPAEEDETTAAAPAPKKPAAASGN